MFILYLIVLAFALLAMGMAGVASSKHFVIIILSTEIIIAGSILAAVSFFSASAAQNGSFGLLIISLWAIASTEIIVLVAFYVKMKTHVMDFNVTKLDKSKG